MPSWIDAISAKLNAPNDEQRLEAAQELLPLAKRYPRRALDILNNVIPNETDEAVLFHLVQCTYHTFAWPEKTLSCLEQSKAVVWDNLPWYTGVALAVLSRLATCEPQRVAKLLPPNLYAERANEAALLSEIHARAWWACAEHLPSARAILEKLAQPTVEQVENKLKPFAIRGAAIAALGECCACEQPTIGSSEQIKEIFYAEQYCPALFLDLDDFLNTQAANIVGRHHYQALIDLMVKSLAEYDAHQVHPIEKPLFNMQFECARETVEALAAFAAVEDSPLVILQRLPPDWPLLMGIRLLIERRRVSEELLAFASELCAKRGERRTAQAASERNKCLAAMAAYNDDPVAYYRALHRSWADRPSLISPVAPVLAKVTDLRPRECLELIDECLAEPTDLAALYEWSGLSTEWQPALLNTLIRRSFDKSPLDACEAQQLCEAVMAVAGACDSGPVQDEWACVYEALAHILRGSDTNLEIAERSNSLFNRGHLQTALLLHRFDEPVHQDQLVEWLGCNYTAWVEDPHRAISERGGVALPLGSHDPLTMVFPSVRIALVARCDGGTDPAATWFERRSKVAAALQKHRTTIDPRWQSNLERVQRAVEELDELTSEAWWDHRLLAVLAAGHLLLGAPQQALAALSKFDRVGGATQEILAPIEYNRACAYARLGEYDKAEQHLTAAVDLGYGEADWLKQDPDFENCRSTAWFKRIVERLEGE